MNGDVGGALRRVGKVMDDGGFPVLVVSEAAVRSIIDWPVAIDAVEAAFRAVADGRAETFPTLAGRGEDGELVNIKFGNASGAPRLIGHKTGTYWPMNPTRGLPSHMASTMLLDPETGRMRALVNSSFLNRFRTAAADAVAVRTLARPDASRLGVIGAGAQAEYEIRAIVKVRPIQTIRIASRTTEKAHALSARLADLDLDIRATSADEAAAESDVIVTVTPATSPVLHDDRVAPGTHVSAMGSDRRGKRELETDLLMRGRLFADFPGQSTDIGEYQHLPAHLVSDRVTAIGDVLSGKKPGREHDDDITIFDSSGIAAQDLFVADAILRAAVESGRCQTIMM
jgi:ornithine cyclodeaminase